MALTFPNSPTSGQFYTAENGIEYRYDGTKWTTVGSDNATAGIYAGDNVSLLTNDAGYITAAQVPAPTPTDTLNAIKTVDGSGSGLDADLLDGQEGTYYLNYNNFSNTPSLATVATSGSYNDLSNQPSIPTNNNQLSNGAGYITSSGSVSKLTTAGGSAPSYSARAFVKYNQQSNSVLYSKNVSSVTDTSAGLFTVNLSTGLPTADHVVVGSCSHDGFGGMALAPNRNGGGFNSPSSTSCVISTTQSNTGNQDCINYVAFFA